MLEIRCFHPEESYGSNCYVVSSGGSFAVIDPSVSYADVLRLCHIPDGALKYIIVTHAHFDHILEIDSWVENTGATVIIGSPDRPSLSDSHRNCYSVFFGVNKGYFGEAVGVNDGDVITLGDDILEIIATPGHTPGGIAIKCADEIFVGDTVFAFGYGRCDLPGGDFDTLVHTIREIYRLSEETAVYSGHGEPSTVGRIKEYLNF